MSKEFESEVNRIKKIVEYYTADKATVENYRLRSDSDGARYVRVEFALADLQPEYIFTIDLERLSKSIHTYLVKEWASLACVVPKEYTSYGSWNSRAGRYNKRVSFVVKFYVD